MATKSIAGEWRGHYRYRECPDQGSGFSAFITETAGRIEGTIIDDFKPTNASFTGSFSFPSVQFTKVYSNPAQVTYPIEYQGSMSEDGKEMSGTWLLHDINNVCHTGTWIANRVDETEENTASERESRVKEPVLDENLI